MFCLSQSGTSRDAVQASKLTALVFIGSGIEYHIAFCALSLAAEDMLLKPYAGFYGVKHAVFYFSILIF